MKKLQALLKNKAISKNPYFQKLYKRYQKAEADFKKADEASKKAKEKLRYYKKKKGTSKEILLEVACVYKILRNNELLCRRLRNMYYRYLIRLGELLQECDERKEKLSKKAKKEKKKKSKKSKTKNKSKSKPKKDAPPADKIKKPVPVKPAPAKNKKPAPKKEAKPQAKTKTPPPKAAAPKKTTAAKSPATIKAASQTAPRKDNLKRIEGIGPKIEQLMFAARIYTYNQIARSSVARLQGVLDKGGRHFAFADPATWPMQAKLANTGKWEELKKWQAELKGGKLK